MGKELTVEMIFEDGFLGKAEVRLDQPDGMQPARNGNLLVYEFPTDGVLKLRGRDPTEGKWFAWKARYRSGKPILPVTSSVVQPGTIVIRLVKTYLDMEGNKEVRGSIYHVERYK